MPRRKNPDGTTAPPKPRVRKKKEPANAAAVPPQTMVGAQEPKMDSVYDPLMAHHNGVPMMLDDGSGMYVHGPPPDYGYYGQPPAPFGSPDPSSPYVTMPPQSSTPQPGAPGTPSHMMMRGMPGPAQQQSMPQQSVPIAPSPLEYRIHDVNRRLYIFNNSGINEKDYQQWWDAFAHEFFDDDARMTFVFFDETTQKHERYPVGRTTIPHYFRKIFENGVRELYYVLRSQSREVQSSTGPVLECDNVLIVNKQEPNSEVHTECKFAIEFAHFDEMYNHRIRSWTMELRNSHEYIRNEMTHEFEMCPTDPEKPKSPLARCGMTALTMEFLRMTSILEPMQYIMGFYKGNGTFQMQCAPREMLKSVAFHHYKRIEEQKNLEMARMAQQNHMLPPPAAEEPKPKPVRKRTRKPTANKNSKKANASPAPTNPAFPPNPMHANNFPQMGFQDVMVVGEPSMMGGDFGEEDERTISRVENAQYDPNALQMQQQSLAASQGPPMSVGGPMQGMGGMMGMAPQGSLAPLGPPNVMPGQVPQQVPPYDYTQQGWARPTTNAAMIPG